MTHPQAEAALDHRITGLGRCRHTLYHFVISPHDVLEPPQLTKVTLLFELKPKNILPILHIADGFHSLQAKGREQDVRIVWSLWKDHGKVHLNLNCQRALHQSTSSQNNTLI